MIGGSGSKSRDRVIRKGATYSNLHNRAKSLRQDQRALKKEMGNGLVSALQKENKRFRFEV